MFLPHSITKSISSAKGIITKPFRIREFVHSSSFLYFLAFKILCLKRMILLRKLIFIKRCWQNHIAMFHLQLLISIPIVECGSTVTISCKTFHPSLRKMICPELQNYYMLDTKSVLFVSIACLMGMKEAIRK